MNEVAIRKAGNDLVARLQQIEQDAFRWGFIKSGHALNGALNTLGYEFAERVALVTPADEEGI